MFITQAISNSYQQYLQFERNLCPLQKLIVKKID